MSIEFEDRNKIGNKRQYPNPEPGTFYTVERGVDLFAVSILAYGYDKTALIVQSNTALQMRNLDENNHPQLFQDERIWIPPEVTVE